MWSSVGLERIMEDWEVMTALEKYHAIRKTLKRCENRKEEIDAKRFKAGGSIAKMPENPVRREVSIIENMELMEKNDIDLHFYRYFAGLGDQFIGSLKEPFKQMVTDKYVHKAKCNYLEERYHYDRRQITRIVSQLVTKFVDLC